MRKCRLPHSPLTTRLSGSARETENRIRSIFQWQKKRPPLPILAISAALILLCGSLVSCQQGTTFVSNIASGRIDQIALREDLTQAARSLLSDPNQSVPRSCCPLRQATAETMPWARSVCRRTRPNICLLLGCRTSGPAS